MIIVDVYVPVYEKTYDMEIDEGLGIAMVKMSERLWNYQRRTAASGIGGEKRWATL